MIRPSLCAAALLGLAACATTLTVVTYQNVDQDYYRPGTVNAGAQGDALPAAVVGTPLPGVGAAAALAPIKLPASVAPRRLVLAPGAGLRVQLIFHPTTPLSRSDSCQPAASLAAIGGDAATATDLSVLAVLCQGTRQISTAIATGPKPSSVDDPAYAETVNAALLEIMPPTLFRDPLVNVP